MSLTNHVCLYVQDIPKVFLITLTILAVFIFFDDIEIFLDTEKRNIYNIVAEDITNLGNSGSP